MQLITRRKVRGPLVFLVLFLGLLLPAASPGERMPGDVVGTWWLPNRSGKVQFFKLDGRYVGRIVAYEVHGKRDEKNPNPELQDRPVVGIEMFEGFVFNSATGRWEGGTIYDFSSGRTFSCILWFEDRDDETLWARGYWGLALFGRTERFPRVRTGTQAVELTPARNPS